MARSRTNERGQVLLIFAFIIPVILGMTGMAVDIGTYAGKRRTLQNAADSIALAAARDLPDQGAALASAQSWADKNQVDFAKVTVEVTPAGASNPNPKVRVTINESHQFAFLRALGLKSRPVAASAVAIKTSPGGLAGLTPWAVLGSIQEAADAGDPVILKYDSNQPTTGNFGIIRLDGSGSSVYEETLINGSDSTVCADGVSTCAENSPECVEGTCSSETGNKVGSTRTGLDAMISDTHPACDTFDEVFTGPVDGRYSLDYDCNPWLEGSYPSHRVIILPVIASLCNGNCDYTVVRFAMFWLDGYDGDKCTGNACEIQGRFVDADVSVNALSGVFDSDSSILFVRLTE